MDSLLTVETYRYLLQTPSSDREEDGFDSEQLVQQALGNVTTPVNRFEALKAAVRRKRKRPTTLTPLDSPQHSSRLSGQEARDEIEEDHLREASPMKSLPFSTMPQLPPLAVNVLERKKLFLSPDGEPVVGIEEILQLQELNLSPPKRASPLQLIAVPRKVFEEDEVALMPCHTLHYRYVPSLDVERWKEPIRDRDKDWRDDELHMILATLGSTRESHKFNKMTRTGPGNVRKGTWRRLDSQRLQVKTASSRVATPPLGISTISETSALTSRDPALPTEVLLRSQGAMISRTYCIVTIYGIGIYGRLHAEGLDERRGRNRYLKVDAYDPQSCRVMSLRVSMADLEWVFEAQPELLAAGKKQTVLKKVVARLYFKYPEDDNHMGRGEEDDGEVQQQAILNIKTKPPPPPSTPSVSFPDEPMMDPDIHDSTKEVSPGPVLCISPDEKMNEAARRRLEREERLRREEQERLRLLALLMEMPKRARHRVVFQLHRISGLEFFVSIYHFPTQVRNFLVVAYNPRTSRTLTIAVGVMEAAAISRIFTMPHKWTPEQKHQIAQGLVPKLQLRASKSKAVGVAHMDGEDDLYRVALAIREDRMGAQAAMLQLPVPSHSDSRKDTAVAKFKKDGQQELQLTLDAQLQEIHLATTAKTQQLAKDIAHAEATIAALKLKDAELKEQIEDINSGKGIPVAALAEESSSSQTREKPQHHEARRGFKAARKTIKDESKALQARVVVWKKELEITKEHDLVEKEKVQTRYAKALELLTQKAVTATLSQWFDPRDRKEPVKATRKNGSDQRTKLHRGEIREGFRSVASGACRAFGRKLRFSVFAELPKPVPPKPMRRSIRKIKDTVKEETTSALAGPGDKVTGDELTGDANEAFTEETEEGHGGQNQGADATEERIEVGEDQQVEEEDEGDEEEGEEEEEDEEDEEDEVEEEVVDFKDPVRWFELVLYDALTSQQLSLRLTRLELITFSKQQHEALLKIWALSIATSPVTQRIQELETSYEATRSAMAALKKLKKNEKKRKQMADELRKTLQERRALLNDGASWRAAVSELCLRLTMVEGASAVEVDRCIYKATLNVVSLTTGSDSADGDDVVDCEVWATQYVDTVSFHARDLSTQETWTLDYPDSAELVKEFAVESPLELQLHIEAIAMTLLLYTDETEEEDGVKGEVSGTREKGKRKMRFEE